MRYEYIQMVIPISDSGADPPIARKVYHDALDKKLDDLGVAK